MPKLEDFLLRQGERPEIVAAAALALAESLLKDTALTPAQRAVAAALSDQGRDSLIDAIRGRDDNGLDANSVSAGGLEEQAEESLVEDASDADAAVRQAVANWAKSFHDSAPSHIPENTPPAVARALQQATRYRTAEDLIKLFEQVRIDPDSAIRCLQSLEMSLKKRNKRPKG